MSSTYGRGDYGTGTYAEPPTPASLSVTAQTTTTLSLTTQPQTSVTLTDGPA